MDLIESLRRARIPQFVLPRFVGGINARLPQQPPTLGLTTALNLALGRILPRDIARTLTGKLVCLHVTDGNSTLLFTLTPKGFRPASNSKPNC
ncbi:MAG: hypothetical protein M5R42_21030 [Rhodocyclaceae bacterium]|nr:hypothetical protein [Rhodocyclaceae bacterium]